MIGMAWSSHTRVCLDLHTVDSTLALHCGAKERSKNEIMENVELLIFQAVKLFEDGK